MPYTPTGRPVGRPKTKHYQTVSLKVPQDLLDRVQHYARMHRQSMSELIRDGLEWRITEGDPRSLGDAGRQATAYAADAYDQEDPDQAGVLQAILTALARQETQLHTLTQALEHRTGAPAMTEYSSNTPSRPRSPRRTQEPRQEAQTPQPPPTNHSAGGNTVLQDTEPTFDAARFMLGSLCQKQHDFDGQGHSLRQRGGRHECVTCKNARSREYKERQRQGKAQA